MSAASPTATGRTEARVYPDAVQRALITIPAMLATTMVAIDITIANVAIPHMQPSLSASQDQIVWVLTSYLIGAAIATPLSGWLAGRFGRKRVMVLSVAGFTAASMLCGASNSLAMMVFARALQGAFGAALIPLSQATLLDINPPENVAKAMAIFSVGTMMGPMVGPMLGGWLTDSISWRWVFLINAPFGFLSMAGMIAFFPESRDLVRKRFDMFGFLTVSIALTALQLMLDRGELVDWFESIEIWIYAAILGTAAYLGAVHIVTARNTFVKPELFKDRNFAIGSVISVLLGIALFASVPLVVVMTQSLLGYSAFDTGLISFPRAASTLVSMFFVAQLVGKIDTRVILLVGTSISALGTLMYAQLDLYVDARMLILPGVVQGLGSGLVFTPLAVIVFSTLSPHLRNEGAAMFSLTRNIGNAVGISLLQRELTHLTAQSRSVLVEGVRPDNPMVWYGMPDLDFASTEALVRFNREIMRQAAMVGNIETYRIVFAITVLMMPLIFLFKSAGRREKGDPLPAME